MARIVIRNSPANSGAGMSIKEAFDAVNSNFTELYDTYIIEQISEAVRDIEATFTGGTINGSIEILDLTPSTSRDSGALVVDGGAGVVGNLNVGGAATVAGSLQVTGNITTQRVSTTNLSTTSIDLTNLTANNITTNSFSGDDIVAVNLSSTDFTTGNVTATRLVTDSLTSTDFTTANINATNLFSQTINSTELTTDNVTASNVTASSVNSSNLNSVGIGATNIVTNNLSANGAVISEITTTTIDTYSITSPGTILVEADVALNKTVAISGDLSAGNVAITGNTTATNVTLTGLINGSTRWFNGNIIMESGYGINASSRVFTNFLVSGVDEATGLSTGSLRSLGGCSIAGNIYVGGNANFLANTAISNSYVPTTPTDSGIPGQMTWDSDYFYVYAGTQWIRFAKDSTGGW